MKNFHTSVLLNEAIDFLDVKQGNLYIDATAGGGGHTFEILKRGGNVLAIDRDPEAIRHIKNQFQIGKDLVIVESNFNRIFQLAIENGFGHVSGILFDLGASSHQFETADRGFSFSRSGPLDMRMDPNLKITAADIINNFETRRLNEIFQKFGQEKFSRQLTRAIISARKIKPIETTVDLAQIVHEVYQKRGIKKRVDSATKVFQALRIVVNSELLNLEDALPQAEKLLTKNGRLVVISFHSLEDGLVKRFFKHTAGLKTLTKTPISPSLGEIRLNPRSRSARLRAAEKI